MSDLNLKPLLKEVKMSEVKYIDKKRFDKTIIINWNYDCKRLSSNEIKTKISFALLFSKRKKGRFLLNIFFDFSNSILNQKTKTQMDDTFYKLMKELNISFTLVGENLEIKKSEGKDVFSYNLDVNLSFVNPNQILESEIYLKYELDLNKINNVSEDFFIKYIDKDKELLDLITNENGRTEKEILDLIELNYKL
tara:strand:+ start:12051 stop:12632 length:582 start_codon:yes stop_codon:yes gene_type:complete